MKALVRIRGLEPPLPCENMDLNHARLPIPPYPHKCDRHFYSRGGGAAMSTNITNADAEDRKVGRKVGQAVPPAE